LERSFGGILGRIFYVLKSVGCSFAICFISKLKKGEIEINKKPANKSAGFFNT